MIRNRVVLVPFPFDDLSASKARPAVCLTESIGPHGHVILAFVTSKIPDDLLFSDIVLHSDSPEFTQTGLKVTSTIRLHRLLTVSTDFVQRELGKLSAPTEQMIAERLRRLFSL